MVASYGFAEMYGISRVLLLLILQQIYCHVKAGGSKTQHRYNPTDLYVLYCMYI